MDACPGWRHRLVADSPAIAAAARPIAAVQPRRRTRRTADCRCAAPDSAHAPSAASADRSARRRRDKPASNGGGENVARRSEEHTSELQSLMRITYAVFCLKIQKSITD